MVDDRVDVGVGVAGTVGVGICVEDEVCEGTAVAEKVGEGVAEAVTEDVAAAVGEADGEGVGAGGKEGIVRMIVGAVVFAHSGS